MTENMKLWLKRLYLEAAEKHRGAAQNERIWALDSDTEAAILHTMNSIEHVKFADMLTDMAKNLED